MAAEIRSLWPDTFGPPGPPTPVAILRQQGTLLGERTSNLVYGEVRSRATGPEEFSHTFEINAPLLAYRHPIVVVTHKVSPYPAWVSSPPVLTGANPHTIPYRAVAATPDELMDRLKDFFQSPETVQLLGSLIAQSEEMSAEPV